MKFKSGDRVRVVKRPEWAAHYPERLQAQADAMVGREGVVLSVPTKKPGKPGQTFENSTYAVHIEGVETEVRFAEGDIEAARKSRGSSGSSARQILVAFACFGLAGCSTLTDRQKKVVTFVVVGTAAAVIAANSGGGGASPAADRQFPCGCSPPPAVR